MTFTSFTFALFLPLVFALYWGLGERRSQNVLLVLASYLFYGWWDYRFCFLMLFSSVLDFAVGRWLDRIEAPGARRRLLALSICGNLGLLGFFKYFDFFSDSFAALARSLGYAASPFTLHVLLPVGISFYTFQTLGYVIDVYRRDLKPTASLLDFLAFVSFFPHLVAGPIQRADSLLAQISRPRRFDAARAVDGCRQMLWGVAKKMVIADNLAVVVDSVYAAPAHQSGPQLALGTLCFAFQIYCDFSAYSDIAIGSARLFGIEIIRNFAYPYFSSSLSEFWQRWHISLSTWFRDYVYIPLGGNRVSPGRRDANLLTTFLLSGLWHGAAWKFVLWGGLHGMGLIAERLVRPRRKVLPGAVPAGEGRVPGARVLVGMLLTFAFVCAGWVLFRAATLADAVTVYRRLATESWTAEAWRSLAGTAKERAVPLLVLPPFVAWEWLRRADPHPLVFTALPVAARWAVYALLALFVCQFAAYTGREFIYFQF
jgi:D-alanyl-lipoteichoic acid acyltransferase DltB (MBOAT superfamily)